MMKDVDQITYNVRKKRRGDKYKGDVRFKNARNELHLRMRKCNRSRDFFP